MKNHWLQAAEKRRATAATPESKRDLLRQLQRVQAIRRQAVKAALRKP